MSAAKSLPSRYVWLKAMSAVDAALSELSTRAAAGARLSLGETATTALAKFKEAYNKPLTSVMYMAGAAMAPSINRQAQQDSAALEKLVRVQVLQCMHAASATEWVQRIHQLACSACVQQQRMPAARAAAVHLAHATERMQHTRGLGMQHRAPHAHEDAPEPHTHARSTTAPALPPLPSHVDQLIIA